MTVTPSVSAADQTLLQVFLEGDPGAFETLMARHQGLVLTACRRQLPGADADDAAQAVFLILARKPAAAARCPSLEAWLLRTARHVAATAQRSRQRRRRAEQDAARMTPPVTADEAHEPEALPLLDRCLDELPERERTVIAMHYLAGRSTDEVANVLGCPTGTVYSHLSRGLARLRGKLARRGAALTAGGVLALLSTQGEAATTAQLVAAPASATAHTLATTTRTMPHFLLPTSAALLAGGFALTLHAATLTAPLPGPQPTPAAEQTPTPAFTPAPAVTPAPAAAIPTALSPDTRVVVRWNDLVRSRERWLKSPFPLLLATPWGKQLPLLASQQPGPLALLAEVLKTDQSVLGIDLVAGQPRGLLLAKVPVGTTLTLPGAQQVTEPAGGTALRALLPLDNAHLESLSTVRGPGFNTRSTWIWSELPPLAPAVLAAAQHPKADLEAAWQIKLPTQEKSLPLTVEWTVEPFGLRENLVLGGLAALPASAKPAAVDRSVFAQLPPTCLWALASGPLVPTLAALPGASEALFTPQLDQQLAAAGLPDAKTLGEQLGSVLIWIDQGAPLPAVTIDIAMPKTLGDLVLTLLDTKQQFSAGADSTHLGVLGFIPVQVAWKDGHLVATTHSGGIAAATAKPDPKAASFATQPAVVAALKELPPGDLLLAGVSRSSESWGSVTRLAGWLIQRKPELVTLAGDLAKAGKYGFLALRRDGSELHGNAGGLFGGPLGTGVITGQFLQLMITSGQPHQPRPPAQQPPAPLPGADEQKPKSVEF